MGTLSVNMPNRPVGEEVQVQAPDGSWNAVCPNGSTVEVPALEGTLSIGLPFNEDPIDVSPEQDSEEETQ